MADKIKEIKEEIAKTESEIENEQKRHGYGLDDEAHWEWFVKKISPLKQKLKDLEENLYTEELLNVPVGAGVTIWSWTDRHAYTVIARTEKTITIQRDTAKRIDNNGMSDCQRYEYERNPHGETKVFRWSAKKSCWVHNCYKLALGRDEYYDYSF